MNAENPTMQHVMQPPLIYPIEAVKASQIYRKFLSLNQEPDEPSSLAYYEQLAKIVKHEWHRIGGQNWLVSQCVPTRKSRELIKKIIPDCIFVTLPNGVITIGGDNVHSWTSWSCK